MAILNVKSLREQVYEYIRDQMMTGHILPNTTLNLNQISDHLGISKTPLRDALIRLEVEGFVTIMPRRGVVVNALIASLNIHNYSPFPFGDFLLFWPSSFPVWDWWELLSKQYTKK